MKITILAQWNVFWNKFDSSSYASATLKGKGTYDKKYGIHAVLWSCSVLMKHVYVLCGAVSLTASLK